MEFLVTMYFFILMIGKNARVNVFQGKEIVAPGLLTKKKRFAIFTLWRAVADNLANGKKIQIGFLDMYAMYAGQLKEVLTVHVHLKKDKWHQKQLMVLVVEFLYMQHHQEHLLSKAFLHLGMHVNADLKRAEEDVQGAGNHSVQNRVKKDAKIRENADLERKEGAVDPCWISFSHENT